MQRTGTDMPSLEGATEWFNATGARAAAEAKGHPTLVHFWSVSCDICIDNLARVAALRDRYEGLCVIAVHTPRGEADTDTEKVREVVALSNITEPCAVDNEGKLSEAFQHESTDVPAYYLYDGDGKLNIFAAGAGGLSTVEGALERVFAAHKS
ncbi:MAG TPA: redoxin domain-containing protein [Pyrinomonadaceae bacterium]